MDPDWAISEIDEFVRVTDQVAYDNRPGSGVVHFGTHMRGSGTGTEAAQRAHVVEQILDRVLSGWERDRPKKDETYRWLRGQASRAKAALQRQEELAEKLGDNAPDMDAANLHSWAWENGKSYWNTGHYNQAVMQAAIRINAETQSKLGRMDVSETALFNEAFSLDPPNPGSLACGSPWMTVGRRTRTYNVRSCLRGRSLLGDPKPRYALRPSQAMVAKSNSHWNSWPRSAFWLAG